MTGAMPSELRAELDALRGPYELGEHMDEPPSGDVVAWIEDLAAKLVSLRYLGHAGMDVGPDAMGGAALYVYGERGCVYFTAMNSGYRSICFDPIGVGAHITPIRDGWVADLAAFFARSP